MRFNHGFVLLHHSLTKNNGRQVSVPFSMLCNGLQCYEMKNIQLALNRLLNSSMKLGPDGKFLYYPLLWPWGKRSIIKTVIPIHKCPSYFIFKISISSAICNEKKSQNESDKSSVWERTIFQLGPWGIVTWIQTSTLLIGSFSRGAYSQTWGILATNRQ